MTRTFFTKNYLIKDILQVPYLSIIGGPKMRSILPFWKFWYQNTIGSSQKRRHSCSMQRVAMSGSSTGWLFFVFDLAFVESH
jgi:hypothetical protein